MTDDWNLYVGNGNSSESAKLAIKVLENGNVGVGITAPTEKFAVNGSIRAREIKVETDNWPDYVFENDCSLLPLSSLKLYISNNKHLQEIPSANEIAEQWISLGKMNQLLMKKIEELTLYLFEMDEKIKQQQVLIDEIKPKDANKRKKQGN